jgi:hypothetical protein
VGNKVQQVRVNKAALLEKVKANLDQHKKDYEQACKDYADEARAVLAEKLAAIQAEFKKVAEAVEKGGLKPAKVALSMDLISVRLTVPESHEKDYLKAVAMLEMSTQDEVELEQDDFSRLVMDEWGWKEAFRETVAFYGNNKVWRESASK